jgi:neutral ceramidase
LYLISGDVKGIAAEYVEEKLGAPCLVMSGAEGDVGPIYSTVTLTFPRKQGFDHLDMFKRLLGDRILATNKRIGGMTSEVNLRTGQTIIRTPFRNGIGADWIREAVSSGVAKTAMVSIPVDFLMINEKILIWGAPLELFCEIAMRIRGRSPFPYTFFYGLNNGYMSYLTTRAAFVEGGHEVQQTPYTEQAEEDLTAGVLSYLWSMPGKQ